MAKAAAALAAREMGDARPGNQPNVEPRPPKPAAEVHVLVIQNVALVETVDRGKDLASEREEHPRNPVGREGLGGDWIIEPRSEPEQLCNQAPRRRETPRAVLRLARGVDDEGCRNSHARLRKLGKERTERIDGDPDVRV